MRRPWWRVDSERSSRPILIPTSAWDSSSKRQISGRLHTHHHSLTPLATGKLSPSAWQARESLGRSPPTPEQACISPGLSRHMLWFSFAHLWLLISNSRGGVGGGSGGLSQTPLIELLSLPASSPSSLFSIQFSVGQLSITVTKKLKKLKSICLGSWFQSMAT